MSLQLVRKTRLLLVSAAVIVGGACTEETAAPGPTRADVIAAYVDAGYSETVAECVVGLGERRADLAALLPSDNPDASTQLLIDSCVDAEVLNSDEEPSEQLAFTDGPNRYGDDPKLDRLWDGCEDGDGEACDQLWDEAPLGSEYERFGVTCGERVDILDCTKEMNGEDADSGDDADADADSDADDSDDESADGSDSDDESEDESESDS